MNELTDIKIELISLVGKAANRRTVIIKSAGSKDGDIELRTIKIAKTDEGKRKVYGIIYTPNGIDADEDYASAETIEKASDYFMQTINGTAKVDTQHNLQPVAGVNIVENWIVRKGDAMFPEEEGAWAIAVKVNNDEVWERVTKGELTGFSMFGTAMRAEVKKESGADDKAEESFIKLLYKEFKNIFNNTKMEAEKVQVIKDFNALAATQDIFKYLYTLRDSIECVLEDEAVTDKKAGILANIDQFRATVENIQLASGIAKGVTNLNGEIDIEKAGKVLSDANVKVIQDAIAGLNKLIAQIETTTQKNKKEDKPLDETIKKQIEDAVTAERTKLQKEADDKAAELQAKIEKLEKEKTDLEKKAQGTGQEMETLAQVNKSDDLIDFIGLR